MSLPAWASLIPLFLLLVQFAVASELQRSTPIRIGHSYGDTIWPALLTQAGKARRGGSGLRSGSFEDMNVSEDGQTRACERTSCSSNPNGTGAANGSPWAREIGDWNGSLSYIGTVCHRRSSLWKYLLIITQGNMPVTLFEMTPTAGTEDEQSSYNISLVGQYDLPSGLIYIPSESNPNPANRAHLTAAGHITSSRGNALIPIPHNLRTTTPGTSHCCPWDLELSPPPESALDISPRLSVRARTSPDRHCCTGAVSQELLGGGQKAARNGGGEGPNRERMGSLGALVVLLAWLCLF